METRIISITNMADESDAEKVKNVLKDVWGIRKVDVNIAHGEAVLSYDEKAASFIDFEQAVADCGYHISNAEGDIKQDENEF